MSSLRWFPVTTPTEKRLLSLPIYLYQWKGWSHPNVCSFICFDMASLMKHVIHRHMLYYLWFQIQLKKLNMEKTLLRQFICHSSNLSISCSFMLFCLVESLLSPALEISALPLIAVPTYEISITGIIFNLLPSFQISFSSFIQEE